MAGGDDKKMDRSEALRVSYTQTEAWLIGEHRAEFDAHRAEVLKGLGFEWAPPLTQEQKDAKALEDILKRNPGLASVVAGKVAPATPPVDAHS